MDNLNALNKITYGLYIVSAGNKEKGNGYISNTVFQITSDPIKFAISCNKKNYTSELIEKHKNLSVSVLKQNTKSELIGIFGFKTGKDFNKLEGMTVKYGITGAPVILDDTIAYLEFKLIEKINQGSHNLYIGELVDSKVIEINGEPLTYDYYKTVKKGTAPKNAPTYIKKELPENTNSKIYKCSVCGHIYDDSKEKIKFKDLPDEWTCPICGVTKEHFTEI